MKNTDGFPLSRSQFLINLNLNVRKKLKTILRTALLFSVASLCSCRTLDGRSDPSAAAPSGVDKVKVIVIDPGHGGTSNTGSDAARNLSSSNNATSPGRGIKEKDLTLELARATFRELRSRYPEVKVVLTRDGDSNPTFSDRAATAKSAGATCFVAIHFNADHGRVSGPRAIIQQASRNPNFEADRRFGLALARAIGGATRRFRATPEASVHTDHELHDGFGSYLFYQMNQNAGTRLIPTCHLEIEFLDNPAVEKELLGARRAEVIAAWAAVLADALAGWVPST